MSVYNSSQDIRCSLSLLRLEIRNAELTESRRSKSARSETVSNEEPLEEEKGEEKEVVEKEEEEVMTEEDEDEKRRGRLSIALTNCGDVLERQLFDAIFWLVAFFGCFLEKDCRRKQSIDSRSLVSLVFVLGENAKEQEVVGG